MENQHAYPTHRWLVLAVACLAIMSCYMNIVAYAPLISQIALSFKIDTGRAMHLISVTYLVTALTLFFAGLICDRYGVRPALLLGLFASVVPALFVPFISNFGPLMIARIFQGISPAFVMVIVGPITGMWFPRREQGIASGLMMGSLSLGAAVGLAAGPVLWKLTDSWQLAVTLLSLLGWLSLALTLLIWSHAAMPSDARIPHGMDPEASSAFKAAIASPVTWVGTAIFFFAAWGMHSLYALVPAYGLVVNLADSGDWREAHPWLTRGGWRLRSVTVKSADRAPSAGGRQGGVVDGRNFRRGSRRATARPRSS